jgi:hypothetical protein
MGQVTSVIRDRALWDDVWVGNWREAFLDFCARLDGVVIGEGNFGPGQALWVGKREVAHFDDDDTLDIRLTSPQIRVRRSELEADDRVSLRTGSSDWLEVRVREKSDLDFALSLVRDAITANLQSAPPGLPPTGADLARRRRFH